MEEILLAHREAAKKSRVVLLNMLEKVSACPAEGEKENIKESASLAVAISGMLLKLFPVEHGLYKTETENNSEENNTSETDTQIINLWLEKNGYQKVGNVN